MDIRIGAVARTVAVVGSLAMLATAQAVSGQSPSTRDATLSMRVAGVDGGAAARLAGALADEVRDLTGGSVSIEPELMDGAAPATQLAVVDALLAGDADLVVADSRAWEHAGIEGLRGLDLPGLITDGDLARFVAASPVARQALDAMAPAGVTGIALWPTGLRHAVSFAGQPTLGEASAYGVATLALVPTATTTAMADALGFAIADPTGPMGGWGDAVTGGEWAYDAIADPWSGTVAISDVALSPGFVVVAIRTSTLDELGPTAAAALLRAAEDVPYGSSAPTLDEAAGAAAWCAHGGRVVAATPDGMASLAIALQPVIDQALADPLTASQVDRIVAYRDALPAASTSEACEPAQ
ncbi:MAG: hypothetical protein U0667_08445 [Chloroflexota bacterium]